MAFGPNSGDGALNVRVWELPDGAVSVTGSSGNIAAATAAASLPAVAGKTNYITGFTVTGTGATAALAVSVTVTGTLSGTMTFTYAAAAGAAVANQQLNVTFPFPIPASAVNTAITVSCPTLGTGNTNNTVNVFGYVR
jgi:hydroxymethylglutaryl-CoA reductase